MAEINDNDTISVAKILNTAGINYDQRDGFLSHGSAGRYSTLDSGERVQYPTGAVRDTQAEKGRFDLIPYAGLLRLAQLYERGAAKYGDNNWRKGIPVSRFLSSLRRHAAQIGEEFIEDHLAAVIFNAMGIIEMQDKYADNPTINDRRV